MDSTQVRQLERSPGPAPERGWGRPVVLAGIFLVLLYLYVHLSGPPLPPGGAQAAGVRSIFSIYGWGKERLNNPDSVASDKAGNIYIADTDNHRIVVFDRRGNWRFVIGKKAKNPAEQRRMGPIFFPTGLAVSDSGDIYVACMARSLILVFNRDGNFKKQIRIDRPIALAIAGRKLFATTPGQLWVFDLEGNLLDRYGSQGRSARQFEYPNGLAIDKKGAIFISDTQNSRIQILDQRGQLIGIEGRPPRNLNDAQRMFGLNMGMAIDDYERVYVVDAFHHSIHVFDHEGNELGEFGEQGGLDGRFNYPSGIAYLGAGAFAVADKWNDRVQVIKLVIPAAPGKIAEQSQPVFPYVLLVLLVLLLVFLSWRRRRNQGL